MKSEKLMCRWRDGFLKRTIQRLSLRSFAAVFDLVVGATNGQLKSCPYGLSASKAAEDLNETQYIYFSSSFVLFVPAILHFAAAHSGLTSLVAVLAVACSSSSVVKKFLPKKFLQQNADQLAKVSQEVSTVPNNHSLGVNGATKTDDDAWED